MKNHDPTLILLLCAWLGASTAQAASPGSVVAWGANNRGQATVPVAARSGVTAIAAGGYYTAALKTNGSVVAWGDNDYGQTTVPVAAQSGVTAIAAGYAHIVALKSDGSVVAWGRNLEGQTTMPVAAQSGVTAIAGRFLHSVALKNDGRVVAWGWNNDGQTTVPVVAQSGVTAIAAGAHYTVALKVDGSVVAWGVNDFGQTTVPVAAQSGVTAIAAGAEHTVALKTDGSVVAWGVNDLGQTTVPAAAQSGVMAIAAGDLHTLALKTDGSVVVWGRDLEGQTTVPMSAQSGVTAMAGGRYHTVALVITTAPAITAQPESVTVNAGLSTSFTVGASGVYLSYQWRKDGTNLSGATNAAYSLTDVRTNQAGSYTVVVTNPGGSVTSAPPAMLTVNPAPPGARAVEAWVRRYNSPTNNSDVATAVAVDASGNVVVTGHSANSYDSDDGFNSDYYTVKYAAGSGALLWEKRYDGPQGADDHANAVAVDSGGNVVVTGGSTGDEDSHDYYTAKYAAADGALLWEKRYTGPANTYDIATAMALDGSDNVVVTGYSYSANSADYYTAKYTAADGALLWEKRYDGPGNGYDRSNAVAVDGSGNVVVTGYSESSNGDPDYDCYTAKYAATDGALLWEKRYNGPENGNDQAIAVAVDGGGNVVVTGFSYNQAYTARYAAADGALLWEKRDPGPIPTAMVVDGSGNVVVTGSAPGGNGSIDYYTAKLAAADGALLWEQRYDSPGGDNDFPQAVAVDNNGDVVVTGASSLPASNWDYYTAKYAANNGALLWEKRYNSPANGNEFMDTPRCLALGPNGTVAITGSTADLGGNSDYATVVYWENLPPVSIALLPAGIRLRFTGVPGHSYAIERALTIAGPWSILATPTAPASGLIEYYDIDAPPGSAFYRVVLP